MTEGLASRVVVFAVGNESRGDDGLAPWLLRRLEALALPAVETVLDFQLQVEHALDLRGADLALFIDAATGLDQPFAFHEIAAVGETPVFSHALSPQGVLTVFERVEGAPPPPAFVLALRGERFELGEGLSTPARRDGEAGWAFVRALMARPEAAAWRRRAQGSPPLS